MANDWITFAQAAEMLGKAEDDIRELIAADEVETMSVGDVDGQIELLPREYIEQKRKDMELEAKRRRRRRRPGGGDTNEEAEPVDVETVDEDDLPQDPQLTQVVTDRYKAVVDALRKSEGSQAVEANLVQIKDAFALTSEAIDHMRAAHAQTASSVEGTLQLQNQIMENLLTALQSAGQNTAAVLRYQQDFVDAIRRLPEPLQSIQDVQLGLIELEEQRQSLEKERVRFEETDIGRLVTMLIYVLLIAALIGFLSIGWSVLEQLPDLIESLRSSPARRVSLDLLRLLA